MKLNLWRRCSRISFCFVLIVVWANWNQVRSDAQPTGKDCIQPQKLNCDVRSLLRFRQQMSKQGRQLLNTWNRNAEDDDDDDNGYVNPCKWQGVTCTVIPVRKRSFTRVSELQLDRLTDTYLDISTTIPEEISNMRFLEKISMYDVGLTGTLPPVLSVLTNLKFIDLGSFGQGTLPPEYSTLTQLQSFHVDYGSLGGTLPPEYSTWKQIKSFGVYFQQVEGSLPREYSTWKSLVEIYLGVNQIQGTLPQEYTELSSVDMLDAVENSLSGEIPVEYAGINGTVWVYPQYGGLCVKQDYLSLFIKDTLATDIQDLPRCQQS